MADLYYEATFKTTSQAMHSWSFQARHVLHRRRVYEHASGQPPEAPAPSRAGLGLAGLGRIGQGPEANVYPAESCGENPPVPSSHPFDFSSRAHYRSFTAVSAGDKFLGRSVHLSHFHPTSTLEVLEFAFSSSSVISGVSNPRMGKTRLRAPHLT